jgi:hypothetical protein
MIALIALFIFDLASDAVSVPGWVYLALILTAFVWNVANALSEG